MNAIDERIAQISLDAKQAHQIRALFKLAFITGMTFTKNIPDVTPSAPLFESAYELYLHAIASDTVEMFDAEMRDYEAGRKTELG